MVLFKSHLSTALALTIAAVGFVLWRAWVCDDAYITFRYVANTLAGHGPVFNLGERVQGFTHPLWFGVLLVGGAVCDLHAFAVIAGVLAGAAAVVSLALLLRGTGNAALRLVLTVVFLLASNTFVEYQTSGLETGLTGLLLVLLWGICLTRVERDKPPPSGVVALLCALLVLNRPDHAVLCGPILLWTIARALWRGPRLRGIGAIVAGLLPAFAWFAFATVYYGTPAPNTAYAKVALPLAQTLPQGARYAWDYATHEPVHALVIVAVLLTASVVAAIGLYRRRPHAGVLAALTLGIWLHIAYVIAIGGDFMRGRFFHGILIASAVTGCHLLGRVRPSRDVLAGWRGPLAAVVGLVVAGAVSLVDWTPREPKFEDAGFGNHGISDEHAWYRGRWNDNRFALPDPHPNARVQAWIELGRDAGEYAHLHGPITLAWPAAGMLPYTAGPDVSVVDVLGLTDAFVARCPPQEGSRVGHVDRHIPNGYLRSRGAVNLLPDWLQRLRTDDATLADDARRTAELYQRLWPDAQAQQRWREVQAMIAGDIWKWDRIRAIPRFMTQRQK